MTITQQRKLFNFARIVYFISAIGISYFLLFLASMLYPKYGIMGGDNSPEDRESGKLLIMASIALFTSALGIFSKKTRLSLVIGNSAIMLALFAFKFSQETLQFLPLFLGVSILVDMLAGWVRRDSNPGRTA